MGDMQRFTDSVLWGRYGLRRRETGRGSSSTARFGASKEEFGGARAWKSYDWGIMDRLHAKGFISDPKSKAKSVVLTPEGLERSRALCEKYFGKGK